MLGKKKDCEKSIVGFNNVKEYWNQDPVAVLLFYAVISKSGLKYQEIK